MWYSYTYGTIDLAEIPDKLQKFYDANKHYGEHIDITIGTDSQNHRDNTKIVSVISIVCEHHGGIFFYQVSYKDIINNVKVKLETETNISLEVTQQLVQLMNDSHEELILNCPITIHIDAGTAPHGKTKDLIQSLTGWVHAMGYECEVKPNSYAASCIADRISK